MRKMLNSRKSAKSAARARLHLFEPALTSLCHRRELWSPIIDRQSCHAIVYGGAVLFRFDTENGGSPCWSIATTFGVVVTLTIEYSDSRN